MSTIQDTNQITLVGRLVRDPELRSLASGQSACSLRLAFSQSRKSGDEWTEESGFIDVTVWGKQGETVAKYLTQGRQVVVSGRLDFREWQDKDGNKRQSYQIVANQVQFIGAQEQTNTVSAQASPVNAPDEDPIPF